MSYRSLVTSVVAVLLVLASHGWGRNRDPRRNVAMVRPWSERQQYR